MGCTHLLADLLTRHVFVGIRAFMNQDMRVIVISDASSVGVSLHAHTNAKNQQQRVHLILQTPWSPEKLVQMLGRTLRSNASSCPIYVMLKTDIPTEKRFLCVIEERMKQLVSALLNFEQTFCPKLVECQPELLMIFRAL